MRFPRSIAALNYPEFRGSILALGLSNLGAGIQTFALQWIGLVVLDRGVGALALVSALQSVPFLLLFLPSGLLADRIRPARTVYTTAALTCLLTLVVGLAAVTGVMTLFWLAVAALLTGCLTAVSSPAKAKYLLQGVPDNVQGSAVSVRNLLFMISTIAGLFVAGPVIQAFGVGWASMVAAGLGIPFVLQAFRARHVTYVHQISSRAKSAWGSAVRAAVSSRRVLLCFVLMIVNQLTVGRYMILATAAAVGQFGDNATITAGLTAMASIGGAITSVFSGYWHVPRARGIGLAAILAAASICAIPRMHSILGFALVLVGVAALQTAFSNFYTATLMGALPRNYQGRITALSNMTSAAATTAGSAVTGWISAQAGLGRAFDVLGVTAVCATGLVMFWFWRRRSTRTPRALAS